MWRSSSSTKSSRSRGAVTAAFQLSGGAAVAAAAGAVLPCGPVVGAVAAVLQQQSTLGGEVVRGCAQLLDGCEECLMCLQCSVCLVHFLG